MAGVAAGMGVSLGSLGDGVFVGLGVLVGMGVLVGLGVGVGVKPADADGTCQVVAERIATLNTIIAINASRFSTIIASVDCIVKRLDNVQKAP
jgi:hypothetical protein